MCHAKLQSISVDLHVWKACSTARRKEARNSSIGVKNDVGRARQQNIPWAGTVNVLNWMLCVSCHAVLIGSPRWMRIEWENWGYSTNKTKLEARDSKADSQNSKGIPAVATRTAGKRQRESRRGRAVVLSRRVQLVSLSYLYWAVVRTECTLPRYRMGYCSGKRWYFDVFCFQLFYIVACQCKFWRRNGRFLSEPHPGGVGCENHCLPEFHSTTKK